jgi:hypothetical protein
VIGAFDMETVPSPGRSAASADMQQEHALAIEDRAELATFLAVVAACALLLDVVRTEGNKDGGVYAPTPTRRRGAPAGHGSGGSAPPARLRPVRLLSLVLQRTSTDRARPHPARAPFARRGSDARSSAPPCRSHACMAAAHPTHRAARPRSPRRSSRPASSRSGGCTSQRTAGGLQSCWSSSTGGRI